MRPEWDLIEPIADTSEFDEAGKVVAITYDHFPKWIAISAVLLVDADRRFLQPDEGGVTLIGANGTARYNFREVRSRAGYSGVIMLVERDDAPLATPPPNLIPES